MDNAAAIASIRYGLGRTPAQPVADPQLWLGQQLQAADPGPPAASVAEALGALKADRTARRTDPTAKPGAAARAVFRADTAALLAHGITTLTPFRERLVWFWANHFTVSTRKGMVAPLAACYVREAIRPHVTGRFSAMLLAVMRHPGMLIYLDNTQSAGPHSQAGSRAGRGLKRKPRPGVPGTAYDRPGRRLRPGRRHRVRPCPHRMVGRPAGWIRLPLPPRSGRTWRETAARPAFTRRGTGRREGAA